MWLPAIALARPLPHARRRLPQPRPDAGLADPWGTAEQAWSAILRLDSEMRTIQDDIAQTLATKPFLLDPVGIHVDGRSGVGLSCPCLLRSEQKLSSKKFRSVYL